MQTGDSAFDDLVYVDSDAPEQQLEAVLQSPEARYAVRNLLERGYGPLGIHTKGSTIAIDFRTDGVSSEKSLARLVEQLRWVIA